MAGRRSGSRRPETGRPEIRSARTEGGGPMSRKSRAELAGDGGRALGRDQQLVEDRAALVHQRAEPPHGLRRGDLVVHARARRSVRRSTRCRRRARPEGPAPGLDRGLDGPVGEGAWAWDLVAGLSASADDTARRNIARSLSGGPDRGEIEPESVGRCGEYLPPSPVCRASIAPGGAGERGRAEGDDAAASGAIVWHEVGHRNLRPEHRQAMGSGVGGWPWRA